MKRSRASIAIVWVMLAIIVRAVGGQVAKIVSEAIEHRQKSPRLRIEATYSDGSPCKGLAITLAYGAEQLPLRKETDLRGVATYNVPLQDGDINVSFMVAGFSSVEPPSFHLDAIPPAGYTVHVTVSK